MWTWGRTGKICNMHVERLLAFIKQQCKTMDGSAPALQRVVAAGCAGQWRRAHRECGGQDPSGSSRAALLAKGAPLRAGKTSASCAAKLRPHLLYANDAWSRLGCGRAGKDRKAFMSEKCGEFSAMSFEQQKHWRDQSVKSTTEAHQDEASEAPSGTASLRDCSALWGLGADDLPIDVSLATEHIRNRLPTASKHFGFGRWSSEFSTPFLDAMFVADTGINSVRNLSETLAFDTPTHPLVLNVQSGPWAGDVSPQVSHTLEALSQRV